MLTLGQTIVFRVSVVAGILIGCLISLWIVAYFVKVIDLNWLTFAAGITFLITVVAVPVCCFLVLIGKTDRFIMSVLETKWGKSL